jgi:hypothetical protein
MTKEGVITEASRGHWSVSAACLFAEGWKEAFSRLEADITRYLFGNSIIKMQCGLLQDKEVFFE